MRTVNQKRRNAVIAAALGAALLIGGGTYAVWYESVTVDGGSVTAGNLEIKDPTLATYDVLGYDTTEYESIKVGDDITLPISGKEIANLANWRIVPGDTVALVFSYDILLEGDNLKADLMIQAKDSITSTFTDGNIVLHYQVFDKNGVAMGEKTEFTTSATSVPMARLTPADSGEIVFVLFAKFKDVEERIDVEEVLNLSAIEVALVQVH